MLSITVLPSTTSTHREMLHRFANGIFPLFRRGAREVLALRRCRTDERSVAAADVMFSERVVAFTESRGPTTWRTRFLHVPTQAFANCEKLPSNEPLFPPASFGGVFFLGKVHGLIHPNCHHFCKDFPQRMQDRRDEVRRLSCRWPCRSP